MGIGMLDMTQAVDYFTNTVSGLITETHLTLLCPPPPPSPPT